MLEAVLDEIENGSIDVPEEIHAGEYGTQGYTRFFIERDVGRVDDALEDEELKSWAVDRMAAFHQHLKPVLDEELT